MITQWASYVWITWNLSRTCNYSFFISLQDYICLRGEVYFPNLDFEKTVADFGCILNDTEVTRYVNITNNSPMEVKYKWSFLIGDEPCTKINRPPKPAVTLEEVPEETERSEKSDRKSVSPPVGQNAPVAVMVQEPSTVDIAGRFEDEEEEKAEHEATKVCFIS